MTDTAGGAPTPPPTPGMGPTPVPQIKLVQQGKKPWSRGQRTCAFGCGLLLLLALGLCLWSGWGVHKAYDRAIVPGERFYPEGPAATDNLVVFRADNSIPGFAEQSQALLQEVLSPGADEELPDSIKFLRQANQRNASRGVALYLPIVLTSAWDEPSPLPDWGPHPDPAFVSSTLLAHSLEAPRKAVVIQYRGFTSIVANFAGSFIDRASDKERLEHDDMTLHLGKVDETDPDKRDVVAVGDRILAANRLSLAKSVLDAGLSETPPPERPADDPRRLLDLLPADRFVLGLHRGHAAVTAIVRRLAQRDLDLLTLNRTGKFDSEVVPTPTQPFDPALVDTLAWSLAFLPNDEGRADFVLRFEKADDAAAAKTALEDPEGPHWKWLSRGHVPTDQRTIELASPRVVHLSVSGRGVGKAIAAFFEDDHRVERARRAFYVDLAKTAPVSSTTAPTKKRPQAK